MAFFRSSRSLSPPIIIAGYLVLAGLSAGWDYSSRGDAFASFRDRNGSSAIDFLYAGGLVALYVLVSFALTKIFIWAKMLRALFHQLLTPLSYFQILLFAALSGFTEEWFFRGVLQSHFGFALSALVFSLAHLIPGTQVWMWSFWCLIAGAAFGLFVNFTDSVLLAGAAHAAINFILILKLNLSAYERASFSV